MKSIKIIALPLILIPLSLITATGVPSAISYQGYLTNSAGIPIPDGAYQIAFAIYDDPDAGNVLWQSGFQLVEVTGGTFSVGLGEKPMPAIEREVFEDTVLYLGITVESDPEITPRTRLLSVPFAMRADYAEQVGTVWWSSIAGVPAGFADGTDNDAGGDITSVTPGPGLTGGGISGALTLSADPSYVQRRVTGIAGPGSAITSINSDGSVGTTPVGPGDITSVIAGTGLTGGANFGDATLGLASTITSSHTFKDGTITFGDSTMCVNNTGVRIGSPGCYDLNTLLFMRRYYDTTETQIGSYVELRNDQNADMYGMKIHVGNNVEIGGGDRYGVWSRVDSKVYGTGVGDVYAVSGIAPAAAETGGFAYGLYAGAANQFSGSVAYGIYALVHGLGPRYAGYFDGNVEVNGTLTKSAGAFRIDHPLDPANKYLQHSFVESPDMMNIYNGNVTTDNEGLAVVQLPDYFEALNMDFRYQLTVIGQFAQAIVAEEIKDNRFTVMTDKPNVRVSWQVTGVRNDRFAQQNRLQVEVEKSDRERGYYLNPELLGLSEDEHVNRKQREAARKMLGNLEK